MIPFGIRPLPYPCAHRATAEEFKQKKPSSKILGTHYYDCLVAIHFEVKYTLTTTTKNIFIESGKLSQLAEDVALKITLFRCLNNLQIGIMKLKMINLPIFHHYSLLCGYVW